MRRVGWYRVHLPNSGGHTRLYWDGEAFRWSPEGEKIRVSDEARIEAA